MMYKTRGEALTALSRITRLRNYLIEGEQITPAEDWFLTSMCTNGLHLKITWKDPNRRRKRAYIGLARSLGLWPIPDWWMVKQRILGTEVSEIIKFEE